MSKLTTRKRFIIIMFSICWALTVLFYAIFLVAFTHPLKGIILYFDKYGEAIPELLLLTTIVIFGAIAIGFLYKEFIE